MTEEAKAIRTPDQRLRVFVSSTLAELADERAAVARAISALRLTPVLFELGARPHPPQELYRAYLAQSDIFIALYWQRYGWVGPGMEISGLEDELQLSGALPRLMYVKTPAPDREPGLTAMLDRIRAAGTDSYRPFKSARELGRLVRDDLSTLLSERFAARAAPVERASSSSSSSSPAPRPSSVRRRSLPVSSTSLIGRSADIAEVAQLLEEPEVRLVTLTGPGGIGKTRLAIAVAAQVDDRYPQGAAFVPLASVTQPEMVLPHIATSLGATAEGERPLQDVLVEHIGETPTLLVLDNLEQIVAVAPELDRLLAACPSLQILATSRTVLRLRAEREVPVAPLTVPSFAETPPIEALRELPAVQLFLDRAQAVRRGFALTEGNAQAVLEICRRLDGLPLALELAAARTRLLDPRDLLARLGTCLDALGTGAVDLPERQRTLRATVEWSAGLLDEAEKQMFAALSIFVDGWTVDAAVHVAALSEDRTLELLDALAGQSLVIVEATDAGSRFRMLAAIRELAAEHLAAGAHAADVARRHAAYFGGLVENASWPLERQAEWAARLRTEEGNLGVAIRWFFIHDIAPLPHIFRILWLFWQMGDRMPEGRAWTQELLKRVDELDDRGRAELLPIAAVTAVEVGDEESAHEALARLDAVEGRIEDPHLRDIAHLARSWVLPLGDDLEGALRAAATARDGFRRQKEPFLGWAALTVGLLEMTLGQDAAARASLTEASTLGGQLGNDWLQASARTQLAALALRGGRPEETRALLAQSVDASGHTEPSIQTVTFALAAHARLALEEGDARRAALALGAADGLRRRAGLQVWPSMRREEAALASRVAEQLDAAVYQDTLAAGAQLRRRDAVALVREPRS
jgi:predicted ATPase